MNTKKRLRRVRLQDLNSSHARVERIGQRYQVTDLRILNRDRPSLVLMLAEG
jgi:hypothetical protein